MKMTIFSGRGLVGKVSASLRGKRRYKTNIQISVESSSCPYQPMQFVEFDVSGM